MSLVLVSPHHLSLLSSLPEEIVDLLYKFSRRVRELLSRS